MKNIFYIPIVCCLLSSQQLCAKDYLLSTNKTSLVITADEGEKPKFQYYGSRISEGDISSLYATGVAQQKDCFPTFGIRSRGVKAVILTHGDGNMSLDLVLDHVNEFKTSDGKVTQFVMKDKVYPFQLIQNFKVYDQTDVIGTWIEIANLSKKRINVSKLVSAAIPMFKNDNWLTHFHGNWASESMMVEEKLTNGQKVIVNTDGSRNSHYDNPSIMITADGKPQENSGYVYGAALAWSGNYKFRVDVTNSDILFTAGINDEASSYTLEAGEKFETPQLVMSYSTCGKGGISRAFHKWARNYGLHQGDVPRDILLNSWEGVYFDINQKEMEDMMSAISSMGGELFVMDDGWFGDKYLRDDDTSSLGDWVVAKKKLPLGVKGLVDAAKERGIKFGIWIEPEMANSVSELYEKHPDWILSQNNRPLSQGRGKTQIVLDLTNPKVQDFVFNVVDNLMQENPEIAYIKWDANSEVMNYGSHYLPKDKQSHIYTDYHKGLVKVLQRIRAKYPKLVMQACGGGGGRVNYGLLPYFDEFWTSDNTDAYQRLFIQWGTSHFYPSLAMASHVSASPNHQTGRVIPLKFRFDVAMSGRLGMEIQPKNMSVEEREFAKKAIASYKKIRPIVQFGDLYRLVSPYDNKGVASLMYADENKDQAIFFVYKMNHLLNMEIPEVRLVGLDVNKVYKIKDLTPNGKPCALDGKIISGKILVNEGLKLDEYLVNEYASLALELQECNN